MRNRTRRLSPFDPQARLRRKRRPSILTASIAALFALHLVPSDAHAQMQYWDGASTTATGSIQGGSGTWDNATTNWTNSTGTANSAWQSGAAIFNAPAVGTGGTVTLGAPISAQGLIFGANGYTVNSPSFALTLTGATPTISVTNATDTATISAPIAGSAGLALNGAGTLILTGANTYTGGTTITSGTLQIGNYGGTTGVLGGGNVVDNGTLAFYRSDNFTVSNAISGTGGVNQYGGGSTVLTGTNTYSGQTTVYGGFLVVNGSLAAASTVYVDVGGTVAGTGTIAGTVNVYSGRIQPGDPTTPNTPGTLTVGNLFLNSSATSNFRLAQAGVTGMGINDLINVTGNLTLAGNLNITQLAGFTTGSYTLYTYGGTESGNFNSITGLPGYNAMIVTGMPGQVSLTVSGSGNAQYWDGTATTATGSIQGGSGTWDNATTNWTNSTGTANSAWQGGTAVFNAPGGTVTLGAPISAQGLIFGANGYTVNSPSFALTLTGATPTISVTNATDTATISAPIAGSAGLTLNGAGTLILTGANTYTGGTTITSGTLQIGNYGGTTGVLGGGNVVDNGTLAFYRSDNFTVSNAISGTGGVNQYGGGSTVLTGTNTYSGQTTVYGGFLVVNGSLAAASTVYVDVGGTVAGTGTIAGTVNVYSGRIQPGDPTTPNTPGTLTVGNLFLNSSATSNFRLAQAGVTGMGINDLINVTGNLTLGGVLNITQLAGFTTGSYTLYTYGGTENGNFSSIIGLPGYSTTVVTGVPGQVSLTVSGSGNAQYWDGASTTATGSIQGGSGTWDNATTNWTNSTGTANSAWQGGTAVFNAPGGTVTLGAPISAQGLIFGANGYTVNSPSFALTLTGATPTISVTNATDTATISAPIAGSAGLTLNGAGTLILTGANTYTGGTTITSGTLQIGNYGGTTGVLGGGNVVDNGTLAFYRSDNFTVSNAISGTGGVNQYGGGSTVLTGTNTYSGQTTVYGGFLVVNGSLAAASTVYVDVGGTVAGTGTIAGTVNVYSGRIQPGDPTTPNTPGTLTVGNLFLNSSATSNFRLAQAGVTGMGINDLINVTGNLTLGGVLNVMPIAGFTTGSYTIFTYGGTESGNFSSIIGFPGYSTTLVTGVPGQVTLTVSPFANAQYWDGSSTTATGSIQGGSGTWDNATTNWTNSTGAANSAWQGGTAVFNAPGGTVTLGAPISAQGLIFGATGYAINSPSFALTLTGATPTISVNASDTATINAPIAGNAGLTFNGSGTTVLTNNNTYTGTTTVSAGLLVINGSLASGSTVNVNSGGTIAGIGTIAGTVNVLSGGDIKPGTPTTPNTPGTLTVGTLVLNSGANSDFRLAQAGTTGMGVNDLVNVTGNLTLGGNLNITQLAGFTTGSYTLYTYGGSESGAFSSINGLPGGDTGMIVTGVPGQVSLVVSSTGGAGTQFWDGASTTATGSIQGGSGTWDNSTTNWTNSTGTVNSSWQNGTAVFGAPGGTVTLAAPISAQALIFGSTGYVITSSSFALTLTGTTPTISVTNAGDVATINAQISGSAGLNANGAGTLVLTNSSNNYTGTTTVNGATLQIGTISSAGSIGFSSGTNPGLVSVGNGGALFVVKVVSSPFFANSVSNGLGGLGHVIINSVSNLTLSGTLSDGAAGQLALTQSGSGTTIVTNTNTYTGATTVSAGVLQAGSTQAFGVNSAVTVNGGALDLAGFSNSIGSLSGSAGVVQSSGAAATLTTGSNNSSATYAGVIQDGSGRLSVTKVGAGTQILTGTNTYTGATNVNAGTLQVGDGTSGNLTGTSAVNVADNATLATNLPDGVAFHVNVNLNGANAAFNAIQSGTNTISGVISGTGTFNQNGLGTTILTNTNTYTGATTVNAGILEVNGSIASATTTVNSLGTLQGLGTLGGHLFNSGTVSPGSTSGGPGTLKVNGNYTQNSGGNLRVGLASTSTYGRLQVNGTASLNGTITAVSVNGFHPQVGNSFQVVTANGGLNGTFSNLSDQTGAMGTLVTAKVTYNSTTATLQYVQGAIPIPGPHPQPAPSPTPGPNPGPTPVIVPNLPFTDNGLVVAKEINGALNDPRMAGILAFLDRQPLGALPALLDRISPEELSSLVNATTSLSNVQGQNIQGRLGALQTGASGFTAQALHIAGSGPYYAGGFDGRTGLAGPNGDDGKEVQAPAIYNPRLGTFLTGEGEWVNVGNTDNARGYDLVTGGFTLGVDYKFTPNLAVGVNAGYAHTGADLENGGRSTIDAGKFGVYGTYFTGGFYVDAAVSGGYNSYTSQRSGLQGTARGDTDGGELDTLLGAGYDWHMGGLSFGPTANFQYTYTETNGFSEHGSLAPMTFPTQSVDSIRSAFGLKATYDWKVGSVVIRPELATAWQHEYGENTPGVITRFANGAGGEFTVFGPEYGRDSLLLRGGFAIIWNDRASSYVYYDGELARQNYESSTVSGGVRITF